VDSTRWDGFNASVQLMFDRSAPGAAMDGHQSSLLDVENAGLVDLPLVKAAAAQGIALVLF
jgi:hypothetical protein